MDRFGVQLELEALAQARKEWALAQTKFTSAVDAALARLIPEAAKNMMSVEQVARYSGLTTKRVRTLMRAAGLDPNAGRKMLAAKAAEALETNAALLGIEPNQMDLTSPLAYLPMGEDLRASLEQARQSKPDCTCGGAK